MGVTLSLAAGDGNVREGTALWAASAWLVAPSQQRREDSLMRVWSQARPRLWLTASPVPSRVSRAAASSSRTRAGPVHVARFGKQLDMAGIIAPSRDADRAIRDLTKSIADAYTPRRDRPRPFTADAGTCRALRRCSADGHE